MPLFDSITRFFEELRGPSPSEAGGYGPEYAHVEDITRATEGMTDLWPNQDWDSGTKFSNESLALSSSGGESGATANEKCWSTSARDGQQDWLCLHPKQSSTCFSPLALTHDDTSSIKAFKPFNPPVTLLRKYDLRKRKAAVAPSYLTAKDIKPTLPGSKKSGHKKTIVDKTYKPSGQTPPHTPSPHFSIGRTPKRPTDKSYRPTGLTPPPTPGPKLSQRKASKKPVDRTYKPSVPSPPPTATTRPVLQNRTITTKDLTKATATQNIAKKSNARSSPSYKVEKRVTRSMNAKKSQKKIKAKRVWLRIVTK